MSEEGAASLRVTMVRCATVLLSWRDVHVLTDPWFGMHLRGLPVFRRPGCRPVDLPPLDAVLVSHLHPDHYDPAAIAQLAQPPGVVVLPAGGAAALGGDVGAGDAGPGLSALTGRVADVVDRVLRARADRRAAGDGRGEGGPAALSCAELAPWEETSVGPIRVTAVPGPHTGPPPDEVNFVLTLPGWGVVFFGGDARLDRDVLRAVRRRFGAVRLALLPVSGTRIMGTRTVMSPREALEAAEILAAARVVPIHEGGLWASVPPLSLHPGRARHVAADFARRGEADRALVLREGEHADL